MLKRSDYYHLVNLKGTAYLLPFGQKVADLSPSFKVNDTGIWIWEQLKAPISEADLFHRFLVHFNVADDDRETARNDMSSFLSLLRENGLLKASETMPFVQESEYADLLIAGLKVRLCGSSTCFSEEFLPFFACNANSPHTASADDRALKQESYGLTVTVTRICLPSSPGARVILENEELCVLDAGTFWKLIYPSSRCLREELIAKDGSGAVLFLKSSSEKEDLKILQHEVFHAIRLPFLILARRHGLFALHSASIEYRHLAFLFSAPSGTGKTTHVKFWEEKGWAEILNGDLNLIGFKEQKPFIYGMPWCGTSRVATTKAVPLGGIFLLKRGTDNHIVTLSPDQRVLSISQRLITPIWTYDMLTDNLAFCNRLADHVPIRQLICTPSVRAAETVKNDIDKGMLS